MITVPGRRTHSGTSVNGIDAALVDITNVASSQNPPPRLGIFHFRKVTKAHPRVSCPSAASTRFAGSISIRRTLPRRSRLAKKSRTSLQRFTSWARFADRRSATWAQGTLQIAEPSIIAERTGITTVAIFGPATSPPALRGTALCYLHYLLFAIPRKPGRSKYRRDQQSDDDPKMARPTTYGVRHRTATW